MKKKYDVVIIGSGPSGMYASYLAKLHNLEVMILESNQDHGGQLNLFLDKPVYDMPAHINITGKDLYELFYRQLNSDGGTQIYYNEKVIRIDGSIGKFNVITNNSQYYCKTIIIATGGGIFKPIRLGIKNEENYNNIHYLVKDAKKFINKKLLIFGGGDSAVDWAHYFYSKGSKVNLIHRRDKFRSQENLLNKIKKSNDVKVLTPYILVEVEGQERVESVVLENKKTKNKMKISCDHILVFYGSKKILSKENIFNIEIDDYGYVVKSNYESSRDGIFAVGNIASYKGKINMMITGLGESATAIGSIVEIVNPGKKMSYYVKKKEY